MREEIRDRAKELGAVACGFAAAGPVDAYAQQLYADWIAAGKHGTMEYCAKYGDVRRDPRLLLEGAKTIISCAFPYQTPRADGLIASYALGADYHYVVKGILAELGAYITARWGGDVRACVDTAPLRERYWAVQAGVGFIGVNNQLIVPGAGSNCFLGELLWTGEAEPDSPCTLSCDGCQACVAACPGGALDGKGGCDARLCASYLTIEHRGELPEGARLGGSIYGCDKCQACCPHNAQWQATALPQFEASAEIEGLDAEAIKAMTPSHYKKITRHSAMRRVNYDQLIRNLLTLR